MTWLLVVFLALHGLVHLAIWLPPQPTDEERRAPFAPDHSALLTASKVEATTTHLWAVRLAVATTVLYVVAALTLALGAEWAAGVAATAAAVGLVLKAVYFNPWLTLGVVLDGLVLSSALLGWPMTLG